jgi:hypothetical protein
MQCALTSRNSALGLERIIFAKRASPDSARRVLFDRKVLMHVTNTLNGIISEVQNARKPISLQRITNVPLEKLFGMTRPHAHIQRTMENVIRQIEVDQAMKRIYARHWVKNRRLAYGETVDPCPKRYPFQSEPIPLAEALLKSLAFPTQQEFALCSDGDSLSYVEHIMSDIWRPFTKTNLSVMNLKRRRSLYQELEGVGPSRRTVLLASKTDIKKTLDIKGREMINH